MAILRLQDKSTGPLVLVTTALFLFSSVLFFLPVEIPHKITIPVAVLTISSLWLCPWQITLALAFSALGDYMGSCGNFVGQMGFFALGHVFYVVYFIVRYFKKVELNKKLSGKVIGYMTMIIFCTLALVSVSFIRIVPEAPAGVVRIGVGTYTCIISTMLVTALLQRSSLFALGAVMFVFSDFILAWNRFVEPVPYSGVMILGTYFLAQWLLFIRATRFRVGTEMRLMRF